ncbi:hypothetical protein K0651_06010 [Ornithinimicrobium sp. Arc0846-15]|nr:hypothetical protein [Ornithinimicrobium laminariae]
MAHKTYPIVGSQSHMDLLENMVLLGHMTSVPTRLLPKSDAGQRLALAALEAYGFTDSNGQTTQAYANLVEADEVTRRQMLRAAAMNLYSEVIPIVEQGATEAEIASYFMSEAGLGEISAEKAVNHYNGVSMIMSLPRNQHLRALRGYKDKSKQSVLRNRENGRIGEQSGRPRVDQPAPPQLASASDDAHPADVNEQPKAEGVQSGTPPTAGSMMERYLEALMRSLEHQVANGEVPSTELLDRLDRHVGAAQPKLPVPSSQGGKG